MSKFRNKIRGAVQGLMGRNTGATAARFSAGNMAGGPIGSAVAAAAPFFRRRNRGGSQQSNQGVSQYNSPIGPQQQSNQGVSQYNSPIGPQQQASSNNNGSSSNINYGQSGYGNVASGGFYGQGATSASQGGNMNAFSFYDGSQPPEIMNPAYQQEQLDRLYSEEYDNLGGYYDAADTYQRGSFEDSLSDKQGALDRYLEESSANFQEDRIGLDKNEAAKGTLFSSGRVNRRTDLGNKYQRNFADARARAASGIRNLSRDAEYQLGSDSLSGNNFGLATGEFDAKSVRPEVNTGLSSVYSANNGFDGRLGAERASNATRRALERLGLMNQDTLPTYYNNN